MRSSLEINNGDWVQTDPLDGGEGLLVKRDRLSYADIFVLPYAPGSAAPDGPGGRYPAGRNHPGDPPGRA